ncbi:MAG: DNA internalization-related competence protein ComEC/Rec2 [Thiohalocapsa sp.]|jgi:competence protein ComEC|uniref:DNA internalization-related competence protein ComEC/Rec2 n=1 Tax=Thiohalocapsa sp. TaxID=2497641 RepID=UPI0025D4304E|nr:DNA internalization-related competence protein ComEC/Rec2 [Thiohalocapsa sp.]MCG6940064.1 DNA internalization-related competence protein ComEC/Rec2 [Thiohalocapsa sp.]
MDRRGEPHSPRWSPAPAAIAFTAGVGGFFALPRLPSVWSLLAVVLGALALVLLAWLWPRRRWRALLPAALGLCVAACGALWADADACRVLCRPFPENLINRTLVAEGRIASLPEARGYAHRFLFQVDALRADGGPRGFHGLVRLSWYRNAPVLRVGERWRLHVRLKPPHGFVNPGGFDYERWLFQRGIAATGHVTDAADAKLLDADPGTHWLDRWRQQLRDRLHALLPAGPAAALVPALVLGDRGGLTPDAWDVLARTGASHLIAISGLHVGLVAGVVLLLVRRAWAWLPGLARRVAAPRAAAVAALAAATAYAGLAGFSISTRRALAMLAVLLLATMLGRTLRPLSGLSLALLVVLLLDPSSVLSYGFWLSFGAVAMLLYALGLRLAPPFALVRWGRAQWAVAIGLLPLLLLFFGRASLVAPAVNLLLVPLFGLLLPLVLLSAGVALAGDWSGALWPVAALLNLGFAALQQIAAWDPAGVALGGRSTWVWLAAGAGALLLLAPRGIPGRWLGLVLLLPLATARPPAPRDGEATVTMLDVGQGLAVVVRTAGHTLVYDMGPRWPSGFNTGAAVVAPYLRYQGVAAVDLAVASHADQDHAGGLRGLMDHLPVRRIISGEPDEIDAVGAEPCRAGDAWRWDGVRFAVLHPDDTAETGNDASCVLRVSTPGGSVLLTGDIEAGAETGLVARYGDKLRADVLVAPHHGSDSSSTWTLLRAVAPDWIWFSAGFGNRFGFPNAPVVARARDIGSATANTATDGAVRLTLPRVQGALAPRRERAAAPRLWRHLP